MVMGEREIKMTLVDGLVTLGILLMFGWVMLTKMAEKSPKINKFIKEFSLTNPIEKEKEEDPMEMMQVWNEKRSMI